MNDDVFNLTPHDIRKQEFRKSLRGYETGGVEDFRVRAADALERAIRDRQVLEERVSALTEQLRVFREREKAMNEALVAAQQLRQDTRAAAEREGQVIVREAQAEAKRLPATGGTRPGAADCRARAAAARGAHDPGPIDR